jgi:hypothetical protein
MGFTNLDLVKKHILEHHIGTTSFENIPFHLIGIGWLQLPHTRILSGSEKVKAKEQNSPTSESISFSSGGGETFQLSHGELIPDSVVVAKDSSLGQIYTENVDFSVDYDNGKITRINTGSIPRDVSAVVWYFYYRVYQKDTDYQMGYSNGKLKRLSAGVIEDGQWVLIDYQAEFSLLSDQTITQAIVEAEDKVLKFIDSAYKDSTDQSLVTAETYLAISILCNIKAMEVMTQASSLTQSKSWREMADTYRNQAYTLLAKFVRNQGTLSSPKLAKSQK